VNGYPVVLGSNEISPDGQRFVTRRLRFASNSATIKVVLNWIDELKALSQKEAR